MAPFQMVLGMSHLRGSRRARVDATLAQDEIVPLGFPLSPEENLELRPREGQWRPKAPEDSRRYHGSMPRKKGAGPAFTVEFPKPLPAERRGEHWWMEADGRELRLSNLDKAFWP